MAGEKKGLDRIWGASWITGHVADETKLWYIVPGQLQDDGPILDEDAFRTPEAMTRMAAQVSIRRSATAPISDIDRMGQPSSEQAHCEISETRDGSGTLTIAFLLPSTSHW